MAVKISDDCSIYAGTPARKNKEIDPGQSKEKIEIPTDKLLHKNKSYRKKNYREYYNSTRGEKISQIYQKDIDIFGYKFD